MESDDGVASKDCLNRIHAGKTVAQVPCGECSSCAVMEILVIIAVCVLAYPDIKCVPVDGIDSKVQDYRRVAQPRTMEDIRIIARHSQNLPYRHGIVFLVCIRDPVVANSLGYVNLDLVIDGDVVCRDTIASVLHAGCGIIIHPGDRRLLTVYTIGVRHGLRTETEGYSVAYSRFDCEVQMNDTIASVYGSQCESLRMMP